MNSSIDSLLAIINDNDASTRHRLDAVDLLLTFESPPEAVEQGKLLLTTIFETKGVKIGEKLEALRIMRRAESPKVSQTSVKAASSDHDRERWRDLEISARRLKLMRAGVWKEAVERGDWCNDLLSDTYTSPPPGTEISSLFEED